MAERSGVSHGGRVRLPRKCRISSYDTVHDELRAKLRKVADILKKTELDLTAEDHDILRHNPDMVQRAKKRAELRASRKERNLETEDPPDEFQTKCETLANAIKKSKNVVVYTGAGISTAASIPDYRGPNGVWTLLRQGKELRALDLSDAEPTLTHMGITKLYRLGHVKHVVSQNCDGLHLRSGLPRRALSELHGNMYIEKCKSCRPHKEYIRLFDVTERTGVRRHGTGRFCHKCGGELRDTIIHFGERGELNAPYRWKEAARAADNADIILCLGSSLKVLRKYTGLWCMNKRPQNRPRLFVVNLQWTPKDDVATLKINGRCDDVMRLVMRHMGVPIPSYSRESDPIFRFATTLNKDEHETTSKKILVVPEMVRTRREFYKKMKPKEEAEPDDRDEDTKPDIHLAAVKVETDSLPEEAAGSKFIFTSSSLAALPSFPSSTLSVAPLAMGAVPAEVALVSANVEVAATDVGVAAADVGMSPTNVGVAPANIGMAPAEMTVASSGVCVAPEGIVPIWSSSGSLLMTSTGLLYTAPLLPVVSSACLAVQQLPGSGLAHLFVSAKEVSPSHLLSVPSPQVSVPSPHVSHPSSQASGLKVEGSDASAPSALQDHCYCRCQKGIGSRAACSPGATVLPHTAASTLSHPATTALPHPASVSGCINPTQDASDSSIISSNAQGLGTMQMPSSSNSGEMQSCCSAAAPQRHDSEAADVKKDTDSGEDEPRALNEAAKGNKRKVTVPGWFGKGLTLKRRKKYF